MLSAHTCRMDYKGNKDSIHAPAWPVITRDPAHLFYHSASRLSQRLLHVPKEIAGSGPVQSLKPFKHQRLRKRMKSRVKKRSKEWRAIYSDAHDPDNLSGSGFVCWRWHIFALLPSSALSVFLVVDALGNFASHLHDPSLFENDRRIL